MHIEVCNNIVERELFVWSNFMDCESSRFSQFNFGDACDHAHYTLHNHEWYLFLKV